MSNIPPPPPGGQPPDPRQQPQPQAPQPQPQAPQPQPQPQPQAQPQPQPQPQPQAYPPPQGQPPAPPQQQVDPGELAMTATKHAKRAWQWQIRNVMPDQAELAALMKHQIADPTMQKYVVWRRSALLVAAPFLVLAGLFSLITLKDIDTDLFNGMGVFIQIIQVFSLPLLAVGAVLALTKWSDLADSHKVLTWTWAVSFAIPLVISILPVRWLIDQDQFDEVGLSLVGTLGALGNGLTILPVIATFPAGVLRGSLRAKGVLPTAVIPGWFLVSAAPFYGLMLIAALAVIDQLAGNFLLVFGAGLLAIAPWYFAHRADVFVRPVFGDHDLQQIEMVQRTVGLVVSAGAAFVALWALTSEVDFLGARLPVVGTDENALFNPLEGITQGLGLVGRWMATTILYTHIFVRSTVMAWRHEEELRASMHLDRHRNMMQWTDWVTRPKP